MEKKLVITEYKVPSEKVGLGTKEAVFVMLSDLHNVCIGKDNRDLLQAIDKVNPDGVLIGGDMLVGKPDMDFSVAVNLVKELTSKYTVYYANGNHEYRIKIYPEVYHDMAVRYQKELVEAGAILLENTSKECKINGIRCCIYGLEVTPEFYSKKKHLKMEQEHMYSWLGKPNAECFNILLAHNPKYAKTYANWGADLVLCGHYHGGMIRIGKQGIISPYLRVFPRYSYGRYQIKNSTIIVSGGLGEHTIPIRYFNPRELVCIRITR